MSCYVVQWQLLSLFVVRFWRVYTFAPLNSEIFNLAPFHLWHEMTRARRGMFLHISFINSLTSFTDLINTPPPQANPGSPPPMNWNTKPNRTQQVAGTPDSLQGHSMDPTALADSAMDESGKQLALLLRHLSLGHSIGVVDVSSQQDGVNSHGVESSTSVNNPPAIMYQLEHQDRLHSLNERSELNLPACLSTSDTPVLLKPRVPPGVPPDFSTFPFRSAYKYYVVVKGKCAGVYYGEWYVFHHTSSSALLMIPSFNQEWCKVPHWWCPGCYLQILQDSWTGQHILLVWKREGASWFCP